MDGERKGRLRATILESDGTGLSIMSNLQALWQQTFQRLTGTPQDCLDQAFRSAVKIKEIEDQYFQGQPVAAAQTDYGAGVVTYFTTEVNRYLQNIDKQLANYNKNSTFGGFKKGKNTALNSSEKNYALDKLNFIERVVQRYPNREMTNQELVGSPLSRPARQENRRHIRHEEALHKIDTASRKTGVLPRSFLRTINRLKQDMDPQTDEGEKKVLNQYRSSRYKTALSIKFLLMLIIIPLLVQQLTKTFFLTPLVESYFAQHTEIVFINQNMEAEAYEELQKFEYSLHFRGLLGFNDPLTPEEVTEKMQQKATEISENYRRLSTGAIANIFADIFSLFSFVLVLIFSREEIEVLKQFIDEIVYGLSDSAKAFLIILFTDVFVGFHSPHGWEVVLKSVAQHFGLPENQDFNFLFIATFPVVLDTVFKYWIFRYLNSISPSAVATYRNMNE